MTLKSNAFLFYFILNVIYFKSSVLNKGYKEKQKFDDYWFLYELQKTN